MKRILTGAVALGFTALASSSASAQMANKSPIQFGVFGGVNFPVSDYQDLLKTGWNAGALLNFGFANSPVGLRIDGTWNQFNLKDFDGPHFRVLDATADAVFNFGATRIAKFYLIGGAGIYNFKITSNNDEDLSNSSPTKFGLNGGAGIKFNVGSLSPFVEARYHYVFLNGNNFDNNGNNPKFQMIPISVGLTF